MRTGTFLMALFVALWAAPFGGASAGPLDEMRVFFQGFPTSLRNADPYVQARVTDFATVTPPSPTKVSRLPRAPHLFLWANRCQGGAGPCDANQKPNRWRHNTTCLGGDGWREDRLTFTSPEAANACTLHQLRSAARPFVSYDALERAAPAGCQFFGCPVAFNDVFLDLEAQDNRSSPQLVSLIKGMREILEPTNRKLYIYTNPLSGPSTRKNGLLPNGIRPLVNVIDGISILLWAGNLKNGSILPDIADQLALLTRHSYPLDKIFLVVDFNDLTMRHMAEAHRFMLRQPVLFVMVYRADLPVAEFGPERIGARKLRCLMDGFCPR